MPDRSSGNRLYTAILMAFGVALVGLGLLGVPALSVAAAGAAAAALGIAIFHRRLEAGPASRAPRSSKRSPIAAKYVPTVLEGSSMHRRRRSRLRHRHPPKTPLKFR